MKNLFLCVIFILNIQEIYSQNPTEILRAARDKCISVKQGFFEVDDYLKPLNTSDTIFSKMNCSFRKLDNDSLFPTAFRNVYINGFRQSTVAMYTGNELITYKLKDSSGEVISKSLWPDVIAYNISGYNSSKPLLDQKASPLPDENGLKAGIVSLEGEEQIKNFKCYRIKYIVPYDSTEEGPMKTIKNSYEFWINKEDFIPVQYMNIADAEMNNNKMTFYRKNVLLNYELNKPADLPLINLSDVPKYINLKDYNPPVRPKRLPADTIAPDWRLATLKGDTLSLSDLKGKLVLIDFFHKNCQPCLLAMPAMQALHQKYRDKGLEVVGIHLIDSNKEEITTFLSKMSIKYPVMFGGNDVIKAYWVTAYPTMYLISRDGRVITSRTGFGEGMKEELEELIKSKL